MSKRKKVVLIGGAGYVGSQLTLDLLWSGYSVVVIDNFTYIRILYMLYIYIYIYTLQVDTPSSYAVFIRPCSYAFSHVFFHLHQG